MTTSALRRQVKNIVHNYSEAEIKVREATSNDPWGPSSSLMSEIADLTFNVVAFAEVMGMVWKRLNDSGKNWRHVYKALTLLDYLLKTGSERVAQQCCENAFTIQTLRDFQYVDRDGRDQGANVREKARQLACLLRDEDRLHQERSQALKTKERMAGGSCREELGRSRGSPSLLRPSSSSPRAASDLEQARPQTSGEEELQLQLALAMSREESQQRENAAPSLIGQSDGQSEPPAVLCKGHRRCRGGEVTCGVDASSPVLSLSMDCYALGVESRPSALFLPQSATRDLADVFGPPRPAPPPDDLWNAARSPQDVTSDPWDSVGVCGAPTVSSAGLFAFTEVSPSGPVRGSWVPPPTSPHPWPPHPGSYQGLRDAAPVARTLQDGSSPQSASPTGHLPKKARLNPDPFGEDPLLGPQINGESSPEMSQLSRLAAPVGGPPARLCRTPEFLGPSGASLVNLDALIPSNPPAKTHKNPFLSGFSTPSPSNPFHCDHPRLTLNQMRSCSTSPLPPRTVSYSPSLPLPLSRQLPILPSSLTQPPGRALDLPPNLPQPLLPLSPRSQAQTHNHNPFL
uniref:Epsin 3 n=1 Tax=Tetraodon nigroviridis TaxID=99883 RepID=H3D9A6_TETNG